jgi:hypothetical protein
MAEKDQTTKKILAQRLLSAFCYPAKSPETRVTARRFWE